MTTILELIKSKAALGLIVVLALAAAGFGGYRHGCTTTRDHMQAEYSKQLADATREAALKQQAETVRANGLAVELITTKRAVETARENLRRRIPDATSGSDCHLGPGAVQLWNEAWAPSGVPAPGGSR